MCGVFPLLLPAESRQTFQVWLGTKNPQLAGKMHRVRVNAPWAWRSPQTVAVLCTAKTTAMPYTFLLQTGTPEKLNAKPVTCTAWVRSSVEVDWPIFAVWTDPNKMLPKPVLLQAAYKLQWSNKDNSEASAQRNKDQELPISSVVGSNPPKEPYKKERSSRLMLLWLASCFLKARSSLCSWSQRTASLLKNYIFPSSTLISLSKHQDIVGDWDRPEEKSSYPVNLLRKFVRVATVLQSLPSSAVQLPQTLPAQ